MTDFQKNVFFVAIVIFVFLTQCTALFMYIWDSTHSLPVPPMVTSYITMGLTYAISALSHQQGASSTVLFTEDKKVGG